MGLPLKNWVIPLKNMGLPLKNFVKIKALPPKNAIFFNSNPKEILNFYNLHWRIPWFLNRGGADIKCNSPLRILCINYKECQFGGELNTNCNHSANYFRSLDLDRQKYIFTIIFKVIISSLS